MEKKFNSKATDYFSIIILKKFPKKYLLLVIRKLTFTLLTFKKFKYKKT